MRQYKNEFPGRNGKIRIAVTFEPEVEKEFKEIKGEIIGFLFLFAERSIKILPIQYFGDIYLQIKVKRLVGKITTLLSFSEQGDLFMEVDADNTVAALRNKNYRNSIYQVISHELTHHFERAIKYRQRWMDRLEYYYKAGLPASAVFLQLTLLELKSEGISGFSTRAEQEIFTKRFQIFKNSMEELVHENTDTKKFLAFYKSRIKGQLEYLGTVMCLFIARSWYNEDVVFSMAKGGPSSSIKDGLRKGKMFAQVKSRKAHQLSYLRILQMKPRQFIRAYEQSCNKLGLSSDQMIISWELFKRWKEIATNICERKRKRKIVKAGFTPP